MVMYFRDDPDYPKGRLVGRVSCAVTGQPLASASIVVQPVGGEASGYKGGYAVPGKSGPDGRFDFPFVCVGNHYVFASLPGYVSAAKLFPAGFLFGPSTPLEAPDHLLDVHLDKVCVREGSASSVELKLDVGGSISGRVTWLDGSPAKNNNVNLILVHSDGSRRHIYEAFSNERGLEEDVRTDEDGNFHVGSLFTGRYVVGHAVPRLLDYRRKEKPMITFASLFYWSGGTPDPDEALPVEVRCGVDLTGIDAVLPMVEQPPLPRDSNCQRSIELAERTDPP